MFRITENPPSASLVQCLAKNYKTDSIVSVHMDRVRSHGQGRCYNPVHVNGHDRITLVILIQALYKAP